MVAHRRAGKTVGCVNDLIARAIATRKDDARLAYLAPYRGQAKMIAWSYLKRYTQPLGRDVSETELAVRLPNEAEIRLYGADNPDALRGGYLDGVVLDEYANMRPSVWGEIVRPCLADRRGWGTHIGTPKGHNSFFELYEQAKASLEWFSALLKASATGLIPEAELEDARKVMTEDQYAQEFECSFEAAIAGAIYAKELAEARKDGRIGRVPYDPALPVNTAWDLGVGDSTAIWFDQVVAKEVRFIDYYENSGEGLPHYAKVLQERGYVYGTHTAPHDIQVRELTHGRSRLEVAKNLGINFTIAPNVALEDGIHALRLLMPRCWWDETKCKAGIEALQHYRWEYNDRLGEFKTRPVHDWSSHCFTGDTEVLTRYGTCQIMNLPQKGEVLTPCGWKPYRDPRVTRTNAQLVAVTFADGLTVRCTPDHLFLTDSGWKSASALQTGSRIQSTLTRSSSISTGAYTVCGQVNAIWRAAVRSFIERCGSGRLAQSLKDAISIIATTIQRTIGLQTLSVCQPANIYRKHGLGRTPMGRETSQTLLDGARQTGISRMKGGFGINGWRNAPKPGPSGNARNAPANTAERSSWLSFVRAVIPKSFAAKPAKPLLIEDVKPVSTSSDVWCLTVPDAFCFSLSNGAVVHNCADAARYRALALKEPAKKPAQTHREHYRGEAGWMR
jgi:phage terminase large subunit